jgi:hypothetical protein
VRRLVLTGNRRLDVVGRGGVGRVPAAATAASRRAAYMSMRIPAITWSISANIEGVA